MLPPEPARRVDPWESQRLRRDSYDLRTYSSDGPRAGYYGATSRSAGRTAAFYLFAAMALVVGGILIFLLFRVLNDDTVAPVEPTPLPVESVVRIESPIPGARVPVNEDLDIIASIVSGEGIERLDLLVSGIVKDQEFSLSPTGDGTRYAAVLTTRFEASGSYDLTVRAFTTGGQVFTSEPIRVTARPAATSTPDISITGQIVAVASLRTGPGDSCGQAGTLEPPQVVTVTGRTGDDQWLQIETGGGLWVRESAVEITSGSLTQVPVLAITCTAPPPATRPVEAQGTATPTPTPSEDPPPPNAPDFIPSNAVLIEGGDTLRITLANTSTSPFSGPIVVRVEGVPADPAERVVNVSMEPNGEAWVNFTIDPPITEQSSVTVTIDPDDAIAESSEDNNVTEFVLAPPPEGPVLSLVPAITGGVLSVTIQNDGGALSTSDARLVVSVPGETITRTISPLAIPEGEATAIDGIAVPRTGESITVTLFIDGINVATAGVPNPNVVDPEDTPTPEATTEAGDPAEAGDPTEPSEPGEPSEPEEPTEPQEE